MTGYTFKPTSATQYVNWDNSTSWVGGVVPNGLDADVNFPLVTYVATGQPYVSTISILSNENYTVHSVQLNDTLSVSGNLTVSSDLIGSYGGLTVAGSLDVAGNLSESFNNLIQMDGGSISAASFTNNAAQTQGHGQITAGTLNNNSIIVGGYGTLSLTANTLTNTGTFEAINGTTAVTVTPGGFTNLAGGTLSGGSYIADASGTLSINAGGLISTDAANITLAGGTITSHDPVSGQDVSLTSSLHTISSAGSLTLTSNAAGPYAFGSLTVAGTLGLSNAQLTASQLSIAAGASLTGASSSVGSPIDNNGVVAATPGGNLVLNGAVTGTGHLEVGSGSSLELNGATAETVVFTSAYASSPGTLQIDSPSTFSGSLTPTGNGDKIVLSNVSANTFTGYTYSGDTNGGTLTLQEQGGGSEALVFKGNFSTSSFQLTAGPQILSSDPPSTLITVGHASGPVCFLAGTRILTPHGEIAVETLNAGDAVITWSGDVREIVWIGSDVCGSGSRAVAARPIVVRAGALAADVPCRDLRMTEGHSLYLDGMLIPVVTLINGRSIQWEDRAETIAVYHVELANHDILVADGAPAESYRDDGNRRLFGRTSGARGAGATAAKASTPSFAPVLSEGVVVDAVWHRLVARAGGLVERLTDDPDLHLIVDGERLDPVAIEGGRYRFLAQPNAQAIVIGSRAVVPALVGTARDHRRLGVALHRITATADEGTLGIGYASDLLTAGFHEPEHGGGFRWTDGAAALPVEAFAGHGRIELELEVACISRYAA